MFNYNDILLNINIDGNQCPNIDDFCAVSSCGCESSTFRYEPHGHVITGDLRIIKNKKLRRLLEKGPKYMEVEVRTGVNVKLGYQQQQQHLLAIQWVDGIAEYNIGNHAG